MLPLFLLYLELFSNCELFSDHELFTDRELRDTRTLEYYSILPNTALMLHPK